MRIDAVHTHIGWKLEFVKQLKVTNYNVPRAKFCRASTSKMQMRFCLLEVNGILPCAELWTNLQTLLTSK